jgi:antitoxin VapB
MTSLLPLVTFDSISLGRANECLTAWGHRMGPLQRGNQRGWHFALFFGGKPVAVTMTSTLIRECVGGGLRHLTRDNCIELSRLCAERPGLCRVALRLWREFAFPLLDYRYAISYQDANLHSGNTYRFDGWRRVGYSHSGTDTRSGRRGRNKWIWVWENREAAVKTLEWGIDRDVCASEITESCDEERK